MKAGIWDSGLGIRESGRSALACFSKSQIPNPDSRRQNGFTLLEVIAAIMLLAIAFAALMQVAGGAIRLSQNAGEHSEAALWARSLLDTAFTTEPIRAGTTSGRFDRRYSWQLQVTPWRPAGAAPNAQLQLYQLDLEVMWGATVHPQSAHFRTLRLASASPAGGNPQALR